MSEKFYKEICDNLDDERMLIVQAAADIIREDIYIIKITNICSNSVRLKIQKVFNTLDGKRALM